jgi:predicted lipoprotein with Yx(FWY)xxD motif
VPTPIPTPTPTPTPSPYTIDIASKALIGNYLVDGRGMTLYYTVSDGPAYSNLPDETLLVWPVFYVPDILVPSSLNASDFGTYTRDNSVQQTTYKGYPLYYYFQDNAPGDTLGNQAGGVWFVVNPDNFPP